MVDFSGTSFVEYYFCLHDVTCGENFGENWLYMAILNNPQCTNNQKPIFLAQPVKQGTSIFS